MIEIWEQEKIINWCQLILNSYEQLLGKQLIPRNGDLLEEAKTIYFAPFVVVSHGTETPPIFNYANQIAQNLWEMNWEEITQLPSRESAIPDAREVREKMLQEVKDKGYIENFQGIRISRSGKLFRIENVTVWNVIDKENNYCGQAATYPQWTFLKS
jgi:MEKHLA domain